MYVLPEKLGQIPFPAKASSQIPDYLTAALFHAAHCQYLSAMTELPVFSIILTVCNAADAMECTIASLSSLEESSWECIILDNGSSDDTGRRARLAVDAEERLRYVYQQRQGNPDARGGR